MPESNVDEILFAPIEKPVPEFVPIEVEGPKPVPPQQTLEEIWNQQNLGASGQVLQQLWQQSLLLGEYQGLNCSTYSSWPSPSSIGQGLCGTSLTSSSSTTLNDWQAQKLVESLLNDRGMID